MACYQEENKEKNILKKLNFIFMAGPMNGLNSFFFPYMNDRSDDFDVT